nr:MAG TPA: hypothetical protein [Caudoviricetes sp.]
MNIIFDEKDLAKLNTEGMEKLAGVISAVANADSVAEKVAEHIGCTKPVTATPEAIEEDRKRTAKKNRAKKNAKEPEPAEEETDDVEIGGTEEEFDRATVLKAIQSLCSTDKSALAKVKKAVKESSQEGEKHKLSACTDEELKELCEEIGVDV